MEKNRDFEILTVRAILLHFRPQVLPTLDVPPRNLGAVGSVWPLICCCKCQWPVNLEKPRWRKTATLRSYIYRCRSLLNGIHMEFPCRCVFARTFRCLSPTAWCCAIRIADYRCTCRLMEGWVNGGVRVGNHDFI